MLNKKGSAFHYTSNDLAMFPKIWVTGIVYRILQLTSTVGLISAFIIGYVWGQADPNKYVESNIASQSFADSSNSFLNGYKISLPEEISQVGGFLDSIAPELAAYKDDKNKTIYLEFTGELMLIDRRIPGDIERSEREEQEANK